ncbi:MAG TPA: TonB-dependent receptor [Steroidobacteraceae bacterium]|nr:TonB-dependent receptor [Steroidobacteraceae bacterium]
MSFERKVFVATLASLGVIAFGGAHADAAQQDAAASQPTSEPQASSASDTGNRQSKEEELVQTLETITVTGYTRSVETSVDLQRFSDGIENVITAADIGGLPDQSIADALTRLPGVAAERIGGEASQINIRGLSGNFIQTTLDGRVQPSTSGSNYIQFDDYPSELINQVAVYKSSQADLIEGGVGGTIAMQTANPLDSKREQSFDVDGRGSYNTRANEIYGDNAYSYRVSAAYQGKFFDDTLGLGLGIAQLSQPHVSEQFVNESYETSPEMLGGQQAYINSGIQINQDGGSETRRGYMGTLVWKPNDHFKLAGSAFYSHYDDGSYQQGLRAQLFTNGGAVVSNPVLAPNGALIGGTASSIPGGFFGIPGFQAFSVETTDNNQSTQSGVFSGGLNAQWRQGPWTVTADLSISHANSYTVGSDVTADPFNGLGSAQPLVADQSVSFLLHGLGVGDFTVANPGQYTNLNDEALDFYGVYPTSYHDRMKAFSMSVKYRLNNPVLDAVEAGIYGQNHTYNADRAVWTYGSDYGEYFLSTPAQPPLALSASDAHTACWKGGEFGKYPCFLAINGAAVLAAHGITPDPVKDWSQDWTEQQSGEVDEKLRDAFVQADIDTTVFNRELTGNLGVRFVHTSQYSPGLDDVGDGNGVPIADGHGVVSTAFIRVDPGQTYHDWLPSLNLNYRLDPSDQLRFAAAKVMARPPIDLLKSGTASWISNGQYNLYSGTNPLLSPMYATQYDLALEHYFDHSTGVVSADVFYKHIDSFVQNITDENFDFAGNGFIVPTDPATGRPYLNGEYQTAYNNTQGGYVRGIELEFQKAGFLPGIWSGLGVSADYAYTESDVQVPSDLGGFPQEQALPGLSKNVADAAVFFDHGGFSTRLAANYRSAFVSASQVSFNFQTVYFASETVLDYQASYNFTSYLSGLLQVLNLTDQPTRTYFGNPTETSTIQYFGRTIYAGINLKF